MAAVEARGRHARRGAARWSLPAVMAALAVMTAGSAGAADERAGLAGLSHVTVSADLAHPLEAVTAEGLVARLVDALRRADPPLAVADGATDRIRLAVSVRPIGATTLRGFWLPFSGTYGIGALRLGVERVVTLPDGPRAFPAVVWQTERALAGPWREADREILRLLDEMVADLLEARRRAR